MYIMSQKSSGRLMKRGRVNIGLRNKSLPFILNLKIAAKKECFGKYYMSFESENFLLHASVFGF